MDRHEIIRLTSNQFIDDHSFQLIENPVYCPDCGMLCICDGYDGQALIYACLDCGSRTIDTLEFKPLFAMPPLESATRRHFEIECPYCQAPAKLVGGSHRDGYYFVCKDRCHRHRTRTIRRF